MLESREIPKLVGSDNIWLKGADRERQGFQVDSGVTGGAYPVIEPLAGPGCAVPTHLRRNEAEHFLDISGRYRIAIGDRRSASRQGVIMSSILRHIILLVTVAAVLSIWTALIAAADFTVDGPPCPEVTDSGDCVSPGHASGVAPQSSYTPSRPQLDTVGGAHGE